jgi:hypothetical protein
MNQKLADAHNENSKEMKINIENYALNENNLIKKNIFYFHNACTQYKFNFNASENKIKKSQNWYDALEKSDKICNNRNNNIVIFGLTESPATKKEDRDQYDVHLFFELTKELILLSNENINEKLQWTIDETKRLNPKKEILGPAPLWIKLGGVKSQLMRNQILKAAKELKTSIKFKNVSISADLSVRQRSKLKELNFIKKELNDKLNNSLFQVNYYYGIRNNKIVKIRKDINIEIDTTKFEKKLKDLTEEFVRHKASVNDTIKNSISVEEFKLLKVSFNETIKNLVKTIDNAKSMTKRLVSTIEDLVPMIKMLHNSQNEDTLCFIENNKKANNNLVKMVLVNCSFTKAIYKELSTNDSETDLTNKLENYIRILENSLT